MLNFDTALIEPRQSSTDLLKDLLDRANVLHAELAAFQSCFRNHGKDVGAEVRNFKRSLESEARILNAVSSSRDCAPVQSELTAFEIEEQEIKRMHLLRSSNLPFYEAVWSVARRSDAVIALEKRVYCSQNLNQHDRNPSRAGMLTKSHRNSAVVDVVARDGLEWTKVSTITEKRLIFEMAKEGWEGYGDDSESEQDSDLDADDHLTRNPKDEPSQLELVRMANILYTASRECRVRFKHPHVRLYLPKIQEGSYDEIDAVIADIRSIGLTVICGNNNNINGSDLTLEHLTLSDQPQDMTRMLPNSSFFTPSPTKALNIDCTILLALISDISHIASGVLPPYPPAGHYHKAITRQIASEDTSPLLPTEIYPLIQGRTLVCTPDAARRMREIVETMGTNDERARADILFAQNAHEHRLSADLRAALARYSCHEVPLALQLPLQIDEFDVDAELDRLASTPVHPSSGADGDLGGNEVYVINQLTRKMNLSVINKSVFLYGWLKRVVTVTSNRSVANSLVRCINEILDGEENESGKFGKGEDAGLGFKEPLIYVCETARSLIGKEKQGR